ncbi:hypothetical protein SK128_027272 [Halocaridina rubra]|uniref:E3 ubiquitin-protein ligase E3D n=1 Tax=Halocaridina rubra TaxID=373956 RepID=A0AAN8WQB6_HALRR
MLQVLAEELPNIQVCNFYISWTGSLSCQKVRSEKSSCVIEFDNDSLATLSLPNGTYLVPCELHYKQNGNMVAVRAQMDETASLINSLGADLLSDAGVLFTTEPLQNVMVGQNITAQCKECHSQVYPNICFSRVLPLPSLDWDHSSEGWFCHLHGDDGKNLKPTSMIPGQDDCFYSELFFLLNDCYLEHMSVDCNVNNTILCKACRNSLGEHLKPSLKLWTHNIEWIDSNGQIAYSKNVSDILLRLFHNIDKDNFGVNCRIALKTQSPLMYLFLVTMNTNQKLLLSHLDSNNGGDKTLTDVVNGEQNSNKRTKQDKNCDLKLRKVFAVKLLYQVKIGDDEETGLWQDDVDVHILPCCKSFFERVKSLLDMSSTLLPSDVRTVNNMIVGYILKDTI